MILPCSTPTPLPLRLSVANAMLKSRRQFISEEKLQSNMWEVRLTRMFHMSDDAALFINRDDARELGAALHQTTFIGQDETYLPLYEGKMFH
jgi:hypothetical protein